MSGICHFLDGQSLPAIDVIQNAVSELGLSQTLERDGSEWTRTFSQDLGIIQEFSDFYGETITSTLNLVSTPNADATLNFSVTSSLVLVQVEAVSGGRVGGGAASSFEIVYDSGGPSVVKGQWVYVDSADDEAKLATYSGTEDQAEVAGILLFPYDAGDTARVATEGEIELVDWTAIIGTAELIAGATYYLSTGGLMSSTPPATGSVVVLGRAMTPIKFDVEINPPWVL